ncbi:MAG: YfcE family phosphodiesterase, partial [Clostridia bacterium]|nr:YfcE family phosphodiesterase [Clostridia bacterium]
GNRRALDGLDTVFSESDIIIHLGDTSADGAYIRNKFPHTLLLNGNCDPVKLGENERVIEVEGLKIFACHGHLYSVKSTLLKLAARAKELGCKIALYGHTHRAREDFIEGVTLINPGALYRYGEKSYLYLVVNGEKFTAKTVPLN